MARRILDHLGLDSQGPPVARARAPPELFDRGPEFGSLLYLLRHQRNDAVLQELARVYVVDALERWEPRVVVTSVKVTRERQDGENVLAIRLRYNVISANVPGNNVLLEGVEQTIRA